MAPALTTAMLPASAPMIDAAVVVLSVLQYVALLGFAGLVLFERVVLRTRHAPAAPTRVLLTGAWATAVTASLLLIPAAAVRIADDRVPAALHPDAWMPAVQAASVLAAALVAGAGAIALIGAARSDRRAGRALALVGALAAVCAPALVGHSRTVAPVWLMIAADIGHLLAARSGRAASRACSSSSLVLGLTRKRLRAS